jgi:F-type H+-transporting ATPase subunit a
MGQILQSATTLLAVEESAEPSLVGSAIYVLLVVIVVFALMAYAKKDFHNRVFKNWASQCFEQLYLFIENMCIGVIGSSGRKYVPMIFTFWLVIFVGNVAALFLPFAPTADLSFNLGMALISIGYVQYEGIKANGLLGHFSHFAGPKLNWTLFPITLMIFVIEIISELMKNVSLSLRLFGNIHGGHMAVQAMNNLGEHFYIALGAFLLPVKILTCVVQALIFTLLTCVYLSLVVAHDDHGDDHGHGQELAAAH